MPPQKSYNRILDEHLHILVAQGNHEAYLRLKKRYNSYADALVHDFLDQYPDSGVSFGDLMAVCNSRFLFVVTKYDTQLCSFFTFWKEMCEQAMMDYYVDNSYFGNARAFRGCIHLDEELDERKVAGEMICERDDTYLTEKMKREMRRLLKKYKVHFTKQEFGLLHLLLEGYSIAELEHSKLLGRSHLYLTCKSACLKLHKIVMRRKQK